MRPENPLDAFMEGFRDASGVADPLKANNAYLTLLAANSITEISRIDLETGGYRTGLEVGSWYKRRFL